MAKRPKKTKQVKNVKRGLKVKSVDGASRRRRVPHPNRAAKPSRKRASSRSLRRPSEALREGVVRHALKSLEHAYRQLELSGHALLKSLADLQDSAVNAQRSSMGQTLVSEHLLQDLSDMRAALEAIGEDRLPETLRPFALLPQALADWLESSLGIRPMWRLGQEIEVPRERLADYLIVGELPTNLPALVRIRVTSQGWQSPTEMLVKPSVVLVAEPLATGRD